MSLTFRFADFWKQTALSDVDVVLTAGQPAVELTTLPGHGIILSLSEYFKAQILRWHDTNGDDASITKISSYIVSTTQQPEDSTAEAAAAANSQDAGVSTAPLAGATGAALLESTAGAAAADTDMTAAEDAQGSSRPAKRRKTMQACACGAAGSTKPRVVLNLQDADQEPAAMAVLAALYNVKPIPELLAELPQEQQLQAALLADMWQLPEISTAAVELLVKTAKADTGLAAAVYDQFVALDAYPTCLLPLYQWVVAATAKLTDQQSQAALKRMLLSVLGDLEGVWADVALQDTLLGLPLPAMTVLLSCDELQVASEDTVLYTAQTYMDKLSDAQQRQTVQQLLAPLIRCPRLSQFWCAQLWRGCGQHWWGWQPQLRCCLGPWLSSCSNL